MEGTATFEIVAPIRIIAIGAKRMLRVTQRRVPVGPAAGPVGAVVVIVTPSAAVGSIMDGLRREIVWVE
ncbi:hypothetical protein GCM10023081_13700 [Arthrobacter ginkgonis]|uniref:Uncharacterized protein n=1 Tax=Arthrobacter ginkgonis TaxID=1630594 RepID=A0ABP7C3Q5_9MICC